MKQKTIYEKFKAIEKLGPVEPVPWEVSRFFAEPEGRLKTLEVFGDQISVGGDFMDLPEARYAIEWFATQLGGNITWTNK